MESFSKQLEPAILPAIRYVRLYQQLQSEQVVFSGKRKPLGRITCHEHNLFANPQSGRQIKGSVLTNIPLTGNCLAIVIHNATRFSSGDLLCGLAPRVAI